MDFHLFHTYGYIFVFLITVLNLSTVVLLAGFAAHSGYLNVTWTIVVAFAGTVFFTECYFLLARYGMRSFFKKHPVWQARMDKFNRKFKSTRSILWATFFFRFIPGFRVITPFLVAPLKESFIGFTIANVLGSLLWAVVFVLLGFYFGKLADHFLKDVKSYEWYVVAGIVIVSVLYWLAYRFYKKRKAAKATS